MALVCLLIGMIVLEHGRSEWPLCINLKADMEVGMVDVIVIVENNHVLHLVSIDPKPLLNCFLPRMKGKNLV